MIIDEAVQFEREGKVVEAANSYERVLKECPESLHIFINLLVLYWQSTDYGFSASAGLAVSFVRAAGDRVAEMLGDSFPNFVGEPEFQFWSKYISWADLGDKLEIEECYELMRRKPGYLDPAMFIYAVTGGKQATTEAQALLIAVQSQNTVRERYIYSVLMSVKVHSAKL